MVQLTRRYSLRYAGYDYGSPGAVFVTICTGNRQHLFGHVQDGTMHLNPQGEMIRESWQRLPNRFSDIMLDAFVIMPDHLHAIVLLGTDPGHPTARHLLGKAIQFFKSTTIGTWSNGVRATGWPRYQDQLWQRGFYDSIVNRERPIERIRDYIEGNPARWQAKRDGVMP